MQQRLEQLRRLAHLRAVIEEIHSVELQQKTSALRQVEQSIVAEQKQAKSARIESRDALIVGDRVGWMLSESRQETAGWRRQKLEQVRVERERLNEASRQQYVASRLKKEQMKRVFDEITARIEIEETRRMQSASDDRFLARRCWIDAKEKARSGRR